MKNIFLLSVACTVLLATHVLAAPPVVTNIRAAQIAGTKNVEILYDVSDADGDALSVGIQVSGDAGLTYTIPATALSGHIGAGVASGFNRRIVWNAGFDWNGQLVSSAKVRVTASDGSTPVPPAGMAYIPAGAFQMGDNLDNLTDALPLHNVMLDAFFIDRTEIAKELWQTVQTWSMGYGYGIVLGAFKAPGHPVQNITWSDAVKWCNARSEREGLTPCYYTDTAQTLVYRSGSASITNAMVKWSANGYRLPTEAEWEKAARGGALGLRYPWGNVVNGSHANYAGSGDVSDTGADPDTTLAGYYNGNQLPAGVDMVNGYGLYDIAGNVSEWCWDFYASNYYSDATANNNPRGPNSGSQRVYRGGGWASSTNHLRSTFRSAYTPVSSPGSDIGFRCVKGL